jgi:hypothetical protein
MENLIKNLASIGIEELNEHFANAGCNDLIVEDSPELKELWDEFNAANLNTTVDKLDKNDDQYMSYPKPHQRDGKSFVCLNDSIIIFALKKLTGLNKFKSTLNIIR